MPQHRKGAIVAAIANTEMAAMWDGEIGAHWAAHWQHYDLGLAGYHSRLLDAAAFDPQDSVLDVGCGNGQLTRDAARAACEGTALGLDLSSPMLSRARERAAVEGVRNVRFEQSDVQVHRFVPESFDVVVSRMGAMFFADAVTAFRNVRSALRSGGRLGMTAWQPEQCNEWQREVRAAIRAVLDVPDLPPVGAPGASGLADPDRTRTILREAGFDRVEIEALEMPMWSGSDPTEAAAYQMNRPMVRQLTSAVGSERRAQVHDALLRMLTAYDTRDGVMLGSAGWLIRARRSQR